MLAATSRSAGAQDPADATVIVLRRCVVEYEQSTLLVAPLSSFLQDRSVRLGDKVKAGQVLGRLYDQDLRGEIELHAAEADTDLYLRISRADYDLALRILERSELLNKRQFVSPEELSRDRHAVRKAALAIEEAEHRRRLALIHRRRAEADVRVREFISPHGGVVVEAYKNQGESVRFNEPVFRVVNLERLKVTGFLNLRDAWRARAGQGVRVLPESAGTAIEHEAFLGHVVFVDSQIDPETQTCRVVAEVDNRDGMLRAGLEVRMEVQTKGATAADVPAVPCPAGQCRPTEGTPRKGHASRINPARSAQPG